MFYIQTRKHFQLWKKNKENVDRTKQLWATKGLHRRGEIQDGQMQLSRQEAKTLVGLITGTRLSTTNTMQEGLTEAWNQLDTSSVIARCCQL